MSAVTDEEIRALVREAVARHLARQKPQGAGAPERPHASSTLFPPARDPAAADCLIEPASGCSHCGHCRTYGH